MGKDKKTKPEHLIREQPVTYADYTNLPDDGIRYEINNGQLEAMTPGPILKVFVDNNLYRIPKNFSLGYGTAVFSWNQAVFKED